MGTVPEERRAHTGQRTGSREADSQEKCLAPAAVVVKLLSDRVLARPQRRCLRLAGGEGEPREALRYLQQPLPPLLIP